MKYRGFDLSVDPVCEGYRIFIEMADAGGVVTGYWTRTHKRSKTGLRKAVEEAMESVDSGLRNHPAVSATNLFYGE